MANRPTRPLTERQRKVLVFIEGFISGRGFPPSVRDILSHFGFRSPNAAMVHLRALRKKGHIDWDHNLARSIRVLIPSRRPGIPVLTLEDLRGITP